MISHDGRTVYFCIDIEASGPVPGFYNMVSIGCAVVRFNGVDYERGDTFYHEIKPDFPGFNPEAMRIHGLKRAYLEEEGRSSKDVMESICNFVHAQLERNEKALFVGHNAPFDWMFVIYYLAWTKTPNPFGYNALDTKALMMGRHELSWWRSSKSEMFQLYPHLEEPDPETVHNALADAEFQADILIALLEGPEVHLQIP